MAPPLATHMPCDGPARAGPGWTELGGDLILEPRGEAINLGGVVLSIPNTYACLLFAEQG